MAPQAGFGRFPARGVANGTPQAGFSLFPARRVANGTPQAGFCPFPARRVANGTPQAGFSPFHARGVANGTPQAGLSRFPPAGLREYGVRPGCYDVFREQEQRQELRLRGGTGNMYKKAGDLDFGHPLSEWCREESNCRHMDFQSIALPSELRHRFRLGMQI